MKPATSRVAARLCATFTTFIFTFSASAVAQTSTAPAPSPERAIIEALGTPETPPHSGPRPQQMRTEDVVVGDGTELHAGDMAVLQFTIADWATGRVLSRLQGGQAAVRIEIDQGDVIPGWWQGMPGMRVGGRRAITLTPELAVGPVGAPPEVFNNKTYHYVVDLLRVEPFAPALPAAEPWGGQLIGRFSPFG